MKEKGIKNHKKKKHREWRRREGFGSSTSSNRIANAVGKFCGREEFSFNGELLHTHTQCR